LGRCGIAASNIVSTHFGRFRNEAQIDSPLPNQAEFMIDVLAVLPHRTCRQYHHTIKNQKPAPSIVAPLPLW
jgi:hypothetical protein